MANSSQVKSSLVHLHGYLLAVPHTRTRLQSVLRYYSNFQTSGCWVLATHASVYSSSVLPPYCLPIYPCCLMYAMRLLMSVSFFAPPFCAQFARVSAASLPTWSECPLTFTHRRITILSSAAWMSLRHTAIVVAFFIRLARPGGLGAVHWSFVYCES